MKYWAQILGAICFILLGWFGNTVITKDSQIIRTDTITTVITDSVSLIRAKAELNYLREHPTVKYIRTVDSVLKVDTILVNNTEFVVPNFEAKIDTTFERGDYLTALYKYPQNEFTILHKYPYTNTQINEQKTITEQKLFTFNHGVQVGFGYGVTTRTFDTFVGYGFTIGLNL